MLALSALPQPLARRLPGGQKFTRRINGKLHQLIIETVNGSTDI
jgi:hypothetical protein